MFIVWQSSFLYSSSSVGAQSHFLKSLRRVSLPEGAITFGGILVAMNISLRWSETEVVGQFDVR
jgi:hypothetical protein